MASLPPGRIGAAGIAFFALAAATPMTVLARTVPDAYTRGIPFVPLVFAALGVILLLFSVGYVAMARRAPNAGALYSFIARGLGRPVGVGAGWIALISYGALQLSLYAQLAPLLVDWFGITAPWWSIAAAAWLVVTLLGVVRVEIAGALLALLVVAEIAVLIGFGAANLLDPAGHRITEDTLDPTPLTRIDRPALGLLLVLAALAFAGVETTAAYGEEARRPRRALSRSTYAAVATLALLYTAGSWATSVAVGPDQIATAATLRGPELIFDLAGGRLPGWAVTLGRALLLTGMLAALISLHHTIARYLFALGRERVLPGRLGRSGPRTAALTQSVVAAVAIGTCAAAGFDPTTWLAARLAVVAGLGVLLLLLGTSLATLLALNRAPNGESAWQRFLAPGLAFVGLGTLVYLAYLNLPVLLGVPAGDPQVVIVPAAFGGLLLLGFLHAAVLRGARPTDYAGIGLGGVPMEVVTPAVPRPRLPGAHRPDRVDR